MGNCLLDHYAYGTTREEAVINLVKSMANTNFNNIKIIKHYCINFTDAGTKFNNRVEIKEVDGIYYASTNLYFNTITGEGATELESLKNLLKKVGTNDGFCYFEYVLEYNYRHYEKRSTRKVTTETDRLKMDKWIAYLI